MPMMRQSQHQQRSQCRAMAIQLIINKELGLAKMKIQCFYHQRTLAVLWNLTESRNVV
jgi:hypothetical protein